MTTRSEIPFSLAFLTGHSRKPFYSFTTDEEKISSLKPGLSLTENEDIALSFEAPEGFLFTMDGLDVVSVPGAEKIADQYWLHPSRKGRPVLLFEGQDFPLVPGYYVITVKGRKNSWHGLLEIRPKYMGKQSWQDMRDELTEEIKSLSFDFMKRNIHISGSVEGAMGLSSDLLLRFYALSHEERKVSNVLEELTRTANSRLTVKERRMKEPFPPGHVRFQSAREEAGTPWQRVREIHLTWNVAENRFVKDILIRLRRSLTAFIREIDENSTRVEMQLKKEKDYYFRRSYKMNQDALSRFRAYRREAAALRSLIDRVGEAPWFQETGGRKADEIPMTVYRDPRYSVLYHLYQNLRHPEQSLEISSFYQFQWKRTDKLYELWCFLQFVKALASKGWVIDAGPAVVEEGGRYRLSSLEAGTRISFSRGEETVHLVYDGLLPSSSADTSRDREPLYTNNTHRSPDLRLDYYENGLYDGSLIADFKYRDLLYLWHDEARSAGLRKQFNAYRDVNTKFYQNLDERTSLRDSRPVKEVWAVFPREIPSASDEDFSLRFIPLAPGLPSNRELGDRLENYISSLRPAHESRKGGA